MIYGFDFDGTLCERDTSTPLPGIREAISNLKDADGIFVATNQAGPLYRAVTKDLKYPTTEEIAKKILFGCINLDLLTPQTIIFVAVGPPDHHDNDLIWTCHANEIQEEMQLYFDKKLKYSPAVCAVSSDPRWRKPKPNMLRVAKEYSKNYYNSTDILYIGDMDTDRQAAEAAGVRFQHVDEFLGVHVS